MKTETNIREELSSVIKKLKTKEFLHSELSHIDMLSGEGATLREEINKLKGKIEAYKWIIE